MKIKKNDRVMVISGRDKGKSGRVIEVLKTKNKVIVEGVGIIKKATRPNRQAGIAGGIVEKEAPIQASNVMLIEPGTGKPTRVGYQVLSDGKKVRISRKTGAVID
ncbi:MAG: 50S ribosomal protein L24 [Blastocatellia bacterium]|nr:50S ribosomal protein L24 [Blastocatellia bacterium]